MTRYSLAVLTGNPADDASYIGAGTGAKGTPGTGGSGGSLPSNIRSVTHADSPVTAAPGDFIEANATAGAIAVTLTAGSDALITVKKTDSSTNAVTVTPSAGTIDGDPNAVISAQGYGAIFQDSGSNVWFVVAVTAADGLIYYQGLQVGGVSKTPRGHLNLIAGSGVTITEADNSDADSSDVTINSTAAASFIGTALSSLSFVDMCAAPYNHVPGDDVTAHVQAVINAANAANLDSTMFFSKPGVYDINGAQVSGSSGTTPNYNYSGQIIFPARHFSAGPITIRIMGTSPPAIQSRGLTAGQEPMPTGGVVLQSNANTAGGGVFDAIQADNSPSFTDIHVVFEDICVRSPSNPQGNGVNGTVLASLVFRGSCSVDTTQPSAAKTGTGTGVIFPESGNMAAIHQQGVMQVMGWPNGISHGEHFVADNLISMRNLAATVPAAGPHWSLYKRLLVQDCQYVVSPSGGPCRVRGFIDIGDAANGTNPTYVVNDPSNFLIGEFEIGQYAQPGASTYPEVLPGFSVNGGQMVKYRPATGHSSDWPSDDFTRLSGVTGTAVGVTSNTHHRWQNWGSALIISGGVLKGPNTSVQASTLTLELGRPSPSRVVRATITPSGTYDVRIVFGRVLSGAQAAHMAYVQMNAGNLIIGKRKSGVDTALATAAAVISSGTTYAVAVSISNPPSAGGLWVINVYLNGSATPAVSYTLVAADATDLAETDKFRTQDGLLFADTTSSVSDFGICPA